MSPRADPLNVLKGIKKSDMFVAIRTYAPFKKDRPEEVR